MASVWHGDGMKTRREFADCYCEDCYKREPVCRLFYGGELIAVCGECKPELVANGGEVQ